MSNYCCLNEESQEFKSLIFNAGTMNDGTEMYHLEMLILVLEY